MPINATDDPRKQSEDMHKTVVDVAKAVSDSFYKVDSALLGLPPNNSIAEELKAIRDNIFVQKQRAEKLVSGASEALAKLPPPAPEPEPKPAAPSVAPAPQSSMASKSAASIPTAQAEAIFELLNQQRPGKAGNLRTDGKVVTLHGNPIFKIEKGKFYASWGGIDPTMITVANVNSLASLLGLGRVFSIKNQQPFVNGAPVEDLSAWTELPSQTPISASKHAGIPFLLCPKI